LAETGFKPATGGGARQEHFVGQGGDEFVAAGGKVGGDTLLGLGEEREGQQPTGGQWLFPLRGNALGQRPGWADDNRLLAVEPFPVQDAGPSAPKGRTL